MFRNSRQLHVAVMQKYAAAQRVANTLPEVGSSAWEEWQSLLGQAAKLNDAYVMAAIRDRVPDYATDDVAEPDGANTDDVILVAAT